MVKNQNAFKWQILDCVCSRETCFQHDTVKTYLSRLMTKTNKMACAPSKDSNQPGHPPSLTRVFAVCMKKIWVLSYPLSTQCRLFFIALYLEDYLMYEQSLCCRVNKPWIFNYPLSAQRRLIRLISLRSEDSDQTGRMSRLIWVFAGRTVILLVLSWGGSFILA